MLSVFDRTTRVYLNSLNLVVYFSVFILLSLILLPLVSSFVNVGAGFLRFSSLFYDLTALQGIIFILVSFASLLLLSFFIAALVSIVKLKETLDHVAFSRILNTFPKYVIKVFIFFLIMGLLSIAFGAIFNLIGAPAFAIQLVLLIFWALFIFTPQVLIVEDLDLIESMKDSIKFIKKTPIALVLYFVLGIVMLFALLLVETQLGQYFVWEHKIISIVILSIFVLPYLQMFATQLYLRRYAVARLK